MQVVTVSVTGFRSIAQLDALGVGSPTLLTGHNDAGKSALLDAIRFLLGDYDLTDRDPTFITSSETKGGADPARVGETIVQGEFQLSEGEQGALGLDAVVTIRRRASGTGALYEIATAIPDDVRLRDLDSQSANTLKERVKEFSLQPASALKADQIVALRELAAVAPSTAGWAQAPADVLKALPRVLSFNPGGVGDAENSIKATLTTAYKAHEKSEEFVDSIHGLEERLEAKVTEDAEALRLHIMAVIPELGQVTIIPSVSFSSGLKNTQVSITNPAGEPIHLSEAGMGRARRVSLAAWEFNSGLLSDAGDVVILYDEPDTHLDYAQQRNFMRLINRQATLPHVRMVIATHSMNLIDGVDIADVVLLNHDASYRTNAATLVDDTEIGAHLGAVAASLGLRNTVLLHERLFVGVEGATEMNAFPVLFRISTGRQLEACGIAMWSCDNNEGALKFAAYLNSHGRDVVFIVDQDSKRKSKHLFNDAKLSHYGLSDKKNGIYLGHPEELEDLFSDDLWIRVANKHWPRKDDRVWLLQDVAALRGGKFSSDLLETLKLGSETGPQSKPELVTTLALDLTDKTEVPESMRSEFEKLISRAAWDPADS